MDKNEKRKKQEEGEKRKAFEAWKRIVLGSPTVILADELKKELEEYLDMIYKRGAIRFSKYITPEQEILNE